MPEIKSQLKSPPHVIVGMSGGVDSSVSALLLLKQGYHVAGLFMKNWEEDEGTEYCTARQDLLDAQRVCDKLGIHLHTANFAAEYWNNVFEYFLQEYRNGRTPNPDILCNKEIKFKVFLEYAEMLGADYIATGHYVRRRDLHGETCLLKGLDTNKDQSYFLHTVSQEQLAKSLFPVGELQKSEVRLIAKQHDLITHSKKDSTGICFIGERRFKDFLARYLPAQPGLIKTVDGISVGEHQGLMYYTIGQRQGLGVGGIKGRDEAPWYVAGKDLAQNILLIAQGNDHPSLFSRQLSVTTIEWVNGKWPSLPYHCTAKTRYRQADQICTLNRHDNDDYRVDFNHWQRAITPGQSVVFYDGEVCLGGGIIESVGPTMAETSPL